MMALELTIISIVAGIVLGLRYKVMVLVPAVMFVMVFGVIIGVARADGFWSIVLTAAVLGTAVQLGYLVGVAFRAAIEWIRSLLTRGRNRELSSLASAWPHTWQLNGWAASRSMARFRRSPPQV
jgi:hypothetical protein